MIYITHLSLFLPCLDAPGNTGTLDHIPNKKRARLAGRAHGFSESGASAQAVRSEAVAIQKQEQMLRSMDSPYPRASHDLYNRAMEVFWL